MQAAKTDILLPDPAETQLPLKMRVPLTGEPGKKRLNMEQLRLFDASGKQVYQGEKENLQNHHGEWMMKEGKRAAFLARGYALETPTPPACPPSFPIPFPCSSAGQGNRCRGQCSAAHGARQGLLPVQQAASGHAAQVSRGAGGAL